MFDYLKQYLADPRAVGAFRSSTIYLAQAAAEAARVQDAEVIVELGPGNGVFTEVVDKLRPTSSTFISIEIIEEFVRQTKRRCPDVHVYHDSATNMGTYLAKHGASQADAIVSGLPWSVFTPELQKEVMGEIVKYLRPGGRFTTFTYVGAPLTRGGRRLRALLDEQFSTVERSLIIWKNRPPAFVYICER